MRVILHSDDLGITRQSSSLLLETWRSGGLDGFSVIANGDATDWVREELARDRDRPARIAVHFNLTEGSASSREGSLDELTDGEGRFRHGFVGLIGIALLGSAAQRLRLAAQVEQECRAQIRAVRAICGDRPVLALDGHNHVHMIPGLFAAVARAAVAEGVTEIRISDEPFHVAEPWRDPWRPFWWINLLKYLLLRELSRRVHPLAAAAGLRAPGRLIGVLYTGHMTAQRAQRGIAAAQARSAEAVEVVFHVGRASPEECGRWRGATSSYSKLYSSFHLSPWRDVERAQVRLLAGQRPASGAAGAGDSSLAGRPSASAPPAART